MTSLTHLEQLVRSATAGPWGVLQTTRFNVVVVNSPTGNVCTLDDYEHRPDEREHDAHYIAAASPDVILQLLADRRELRDALAEALSAIEEGDGPYGMSRHRFAKLTALAAKHQEKP